MNRFEYVKPRSLDETCDLLKKGGTAKAGGIDLLDRMKEGISKPERLVGLASGQPEGARIVVDGEGATIGALATLAAVAADRRLAKFYPALVAAAGEAATPQVRNRATVGGNLLQEPRCWYYRLNDFDCLRKTGKNCPALHGRNRYHAILGYGPCPIVAPSNLAPALVALGATAEIAGGPSPRPVEGLYAPPDDTKRFFTLAPGEVVTAVALGPVGENAYVEVRHKRSFDWALASAAVARRAGKGWRIVLGAVAPGPWRAKEAEAALGDGVPDAAAIAKAADLAVKGAKPLSENAYKVKLARVAVTRALTEAAGGR